METPKLNTTHEFIFSDGSTTKMTLTFYELLQLKSRDKTLYDRYNRAFNAMGKEKSDELDSLTILYVAYRCANKNEEKPLTEEEFIIKCGCDRNAVGRAVQALLSPKN